MKWLSLNPRRLVFALGIGFFLLSQLLMSWQLWQRTGNVPPGFDDSYFYITKIDFLNTYHSLVPNLDGINRASRFDAGSKNATYTLIFGSLASITNLSSEGMYQASFFLGKIVLLVVLLIFFRALRLPLITQAGSFFVLGAYSGTAATHGFFWVVPDFWLFVFFILLATYLVKPPSRPVPLILIGLSLTLLFYFIHPLSLWAGGVLLCFGLLIISLGDRKLRQNRLKALAVFALTIVGSYLLTYAGNWYFGSSSSHNISTQFSSAGTEVVSSEDLPGGFWQSIKRFLPSLWLIWRGYLRFILFPPIAVLLLIGLRGLFQDKKSVLAYLFLTTLIATIAVSFHAFGYRTVMFTWPLTLIVLASGMIYSGVLLSKIGRRDWIKNILATAMIGCFTFGLLLYSYRFITGFQGRSAAISWDKNCPAELLAATTKEETIAYRDRFAASSFRANGLLVRKLTNPDIFIPLKEQNIFEVYSPTLNNSSHFQSESGRTLWRDCGWFKIDQVRLSP